MNPHNKDTVYTIIVAVGGFVAQMTNLDLLLKVLIGAAAWMLVRWWRINLNRDWRLIRGSPAF